MQSNKDFCKHLSKVAADKSSSRPILMPIGSVQAISLFLKSAVLYSFMSSSISVFLSRHSNTSLSVIETSFCQFRKFSELGRMLTRVFLDHKTCTQYLDSRFNFTILVIKRALEATGIFLRRSHGLGKLRCF